MFLYKGLYLDCGALRMMEHLLVVCLFACFFLPKPIASSENWHGLSLNLDRIVVRGFLGKHMTSEEISPAERVKLENGVQITWRGHASLSVTDSHILSRYDVTCQDITWLAEDCRVTIFEDCYPLDDAHWYGGAAIKELLWPIEKWDREMKPFVTGDSIGPEADSNSGFSGMLERYWLNSKGQSFFVDSDVPLWISVNDTGSDQICFRSTYDDSPYINYDNAPLFLNYTICQAADVREMQLFAIDNFLGRPSGIPDTRLFKYPIYSTWARYHHNISQATVIEFANEIVAHNFSNAQIEIDDDWETNYGQLDFNLDRFPDPAAMVDELSDIGFRTTVWVHPFVDILPENDWMGGMKDPGGSLPALAAWWNGVATTYDFTDDQAVGRWHEKLDNLRQRYGISSFKFDAGEVVYLPAAYRPQVPFRNPCEYSRRYAEAAYLADADIRHQEVRVGYRSQSLPVFVRLLDKYSKWDHDNGLRSIIPHVLQMSVIGYVFPLPDMVGGNAYADRFPDRELFVRWTELNVFLPAFQFSIVPWQYDDEVVQICRRMLSLHEQYSELMIELAENSTRTGQPIVRPLWWVAPGDLVALEIDSEFLLGDDLLVAPIVHEGALARDIYLPAGRWRDMNDPEVILDGEQWHNGYPAPLDVLPYFTRVN